MHTAGESFVDVICGTIIVQWWAGFSHDVVLIINRRHIH